MKQILITILTVLILFTCVGCIARPIENIMSGKTSEKETGQENKSEEFVFPETAVFEKGYINMKLPICEGWEYEIIEDEYPGIRFMKKGAKDEYAELRYYGMFGVCGTGLEEESTEFPEGQKVRFGYYDGNKEWSFIAFYDAAGDYAATNCGLMDEDADTAVSMLKQAVVGEGSMTRSEAIEAGKPDDTYTCRYQPIFDTESGSWKIEYVRLGEDKTVSVIINHDGTVKKDGTE